MNINQSTKNTTNQNNNTLTNDNTITKSVSHYSTPFSVYSSAKLGPTSIQGVAAQMTPKTLYDYLIDSPIPYKNTPLDPTPYLIQCEKLIRQLLAPLTTPNIQPFASRILYLLNASYLSQKAKDKINDDYSFITKHYTSKTEPALRKKLTDTLPFIAISQKKLSPKHLLPNRTVKAFQLYKAYTQLTPIIDPYFKQATLKAFGHQDL